MPVDPLHIHADQPHPATIDPGRPYGCHNHSPRIEQGLQVMQVGWHPDGRRKMDTVITRWLPVECGHHGTGLNRHNDPKCAGCCWRDTINPQYPV